jgi:hypothetical protein
MPRPERRAAVARLRRIQRLLVLRSLRRHEDRLLVLALAAGVVIMVLHWLP